MIMRGILLAATALVATQARAGDTPVYAPAPAWVKAAPLPDTAKLSTAAPILILDQQQKLQDGELWVYVDSATHIASSQMLNQAGTMTIPWMPNQGDLIIHRAEIVRGAERIDLLAGGERFTVLRREEELEQLRLNGLLTATMNVQGLRVGDVLRLTASITRKDGALAGNMQTFVPLLPQEARPEFARVRLLWPQGQHVKWKTFQDGIKPVLSASGGFSEVEIPVPLGKQPEVPGDAPMRFRRPPVLEATTFADWNAVSRTMAPLYKTDGAIADGGPVAAQVTAIMAKHSDPRARAAAALRVVQDEVRYLFKGMDGGNYVPQTPADTWELRYGDCKAKTLLLLAMLHRMGIEAEAVLVNSSLGDVVPERLPSAGAFDHVVVRATIAGQPVWLDGTVSGTRLADLGDTPPFRNVLPLRAGGAALEPLPMHANARPDVDVALELDQSIGIGLPTPYKIAITMRGPAAEMLQVASVQAKGEQRDDLVREMVGRFIDAGITTDHALSYDAETGTALVTANGLSTSRWNWNESRFRFDLDRTVSQLSFEPDRARTAWQTIPVATGEPSSMRFRTRLRLPNKGAGFTLEGDTTLPPTLAGVQLRRTAALDDGWITVDDRVDIIGAEIAPAAIPAARSAYTLASARLLRAIAPADYPPRWQIAADGRKNKSFAPILAIFAKAIKADPDEMTTYQSRASFLSGVYDHRAALPDLDRILATEPDVSTYLWRARIHTALGDDAKALADIEAARALDPGSQDALQQLVALHSEAGATDKALALVEEKIAEGGKEKANFLSLKSEVLARAGQAEAALAAADSAVAAGPGNAHLLNGRCWRKATLKIALDTALKDCTKAIELADNPAAPLDSRALVYFQMGRMDDARADVDAALNLAPAMDASLYLRGVMRKRAGEVAAGEADLAAARMMSPRIDEDYRRWGVVP